MARRIIRRRDAIFWTVIVLLGLAWIGCSSSVKGKRGEPVEGKDAGVGKYYFFDDVLIPNELSFEQDDSFVYETPQFKTGSMIFKKWWLDPGSVVDFFLYYMERDNWKLVNTYRGKESTLNFSKPDKTCTIKVTEKWNGTTVVEVRVGPLGTKKM